MSRSDERDGRAWDEDMPSLRERLGLAVRQNPIRGLVVLFLLLLGLGFLVAGVVAFRGAIWAAIVAFCGAIWAATVGTASALLAGDPLALLGVVVVFVAIGVPVLLLRRG